MSPKPKLRLHREALIELQASEMASIGGGEPETAGCITRTLVCVTVGDCQITRTIVC